MLALIFEIGHSVLILEQSLCNALSCKTFPLNTGRDLSINMIIHSSFTLMLIPSVYMYL